MSGSPRWRFGVETRVAQIIQGERKEVQHEYMRVVATLVQMVETYNDLGIAACVNGFTVPLQNGKELYCAVIGKTHEIRIFNYE